VFPQDQVYNKKAFADISSRPRENSGPVLADYKFLRKRQVNRMDNCDGHGRSRQTGKEYDQMPGEPDHKDPFCF